MVVFSSLPGGSLGLGAADLGTVLAAFALRLRHRQQVTTSTAGAPKGCQKEFSRQDSHKSLTNCCTTHCDGMGTRSLCAAHCREAPEEGWRQAAH